MQVTDIGILWIILCFFCIFTKWKYMIRLLMISAPLQGVAVFNLYGSGLPAFMLVEISVVVKAMIEVFTDKENNVLRMSGKTVIPVLGFALWSIFANLVLSRFFDSSLVDNGTTSFNKIAIILIHLLAVCAVNARAHVECGGDLIHSFYIMLSMVLLLGYYTYFAARYGISLEWMRDILSNNAGYPSIFVQMGRLHIPYLEPSFCGGFLAPVFWGLVAMNKKTGKLFAIATLPALALNASGTGIVTFAAGLLLFLVLNHKGAYWKWFAVISAILAVMLSNYELRNLIINMVAHKLQSRSGMERMSFDKEALRLCIQSWGMGVGFVNCRASSLVTTLLACTGVIGFAFYICFLCNVISWKSIKDSGELSCYSIALILTFVAQALALPDVNYFMLWMYVFIIDIAKKNNVGYEENVAELEVRHNEGDSYRSCSSWACDQ